MSHIRVLKPILFTSWRLTQLQARLKKKREDVTCKITELFSIINENVLLITNAYKHQNINLLFSKDPQLHKGLTQCLPSPHFCFLFIHVRHGNLCQNDNGHLHYRTTCVSSPPRGGGVFPYMGYIGMCGRKGYSFSAVLIINWVLILAILSPFWS